MANDVDISQLKSKAIYSDLNRNFGQDGVADILLDGPAISQSLFNILTTLVGEAGPIFLPDFGSALPQLLQEPLDQVTAFSVKAASIQAIQRWETRIDVDIGQSVVATDYALPGYVVRVVYTIRHTGEMSSTDIPLSQRGSSGASLTPPTSAAPIWEPTQVSSLQLWYDGADSKSVTQSISSLMKWKDKSGRSNTATVRSPAANPFNLTSASIHGLSAIRVATGSNPNTLRLSSDIQLSSNFHLFVAMRNADQTFSIGDSYGFNLLSETGSSAEEALLTVKLGLSNTVVMPVVTCRPRSQSAPILSTSNVVPLNGVEAEFLELKYGSGVLSVYLNRSEVARVNDSSLPGMTVSSLLTSVGGIVGDPSLYVGEIIFLNSPSAILSEDVIQIQDYFYSKWLSTSIASGAAAVAKPITSEIYITSSVTNVNGNGSQAKITIQHLRTSNQQPIQYKVLASGQFVTSAKEFTSGSILRYSGADLVDTNPIVFKHGNVPYPNSELIAFLPSVVDNPWNELLSVGLLFTSIASTDGRTELTVIFPVGTTFGDLTFTVLALGSNLSTPTSTTITI